MEIPTFIESYHTEQYDLCDRIIDRLEYYLSERTSNANLQQHFLDGRDYNTSETNRQDYSFDFWILEDPLNAEMHNLLSQYIPLYCEKYQGFAWHSSISRNMKVQKTMPKGGFHAWHAEANFTQNFPGHMRTLVWTFYLNDVPDGEGETEFLEYGIKVKPEKGKLCFFPPAWTHFHRGNPVYTTTKYIATGWYYAVE